MDSFEFVKLMPPPGFSWSCYSTPEGHRDKRRIAGKARTFIRRMQKLHDNKPPWGNRGAMTDLAERFVWETLRNAPKWFGDGGGLDTEPRYQILDFAERVLNHAGIKNWRMQ